MEIYQLYNYIAKVIQNKYGGINIIIRNIGLLKLSVTFDTYELNIVHNVNYTLFGVQDSYFIELIDYTYAVPVAMKFNVQGFRKLYNTIDYLFDHFIGPPGDVY